LKNFGFLAASWLLIIIHLVWGEFKLRKYSNALVREKDFKGACLRALPTRVEFRQEVADGFFVTARAATRNCGAFSRNQPPKYL
jgi:hypothetical protein